MPTPTLRRVLIIAICGALVFALLVSVFFQVVVVPTALTDEARFDPVIARGRIAFTIVGVLGIACFQAVLIAIGALLLSSWNDRIFSRRSLLWVDITIGACLVAAGLCFFALFADSVSPELPANSFHEGAGDSTSIAQLFFGLAGTATCFTGALVVGVLRDLLARATTIRHELDQVI
ncbi:MAG: DUF2975 domain-containing protein [Pseudoclavibacter sp.]